MDFGRAAAKTVNERAANLKLYQDVEDTSLDLHGAARIGYLQRRQKNIEDAIRRRDKQLWSESFFAQDIDQRATVTGTNDHGSVRTAKNQGQVRP